MPHQALHIEPGVLLNARYRISRVLGVGATGTVLSALDCMVQQQPVALKVLHPHLLRTGRSAPARLRKELRTTRALQHPHIVRTYELHRGQRGLLFFSMELVEGADLAAVCLDERHPALDLDARLLLLHQVADGLAFAHEQGLIHRDIKPQNVLVSGATAKISDFGTARALETDDALTTTGETIGTPYYMAPEQFRGEPVDARCDVYAFGIMAFEILTGSRPFTDTSFYNLALKHLTEPVPRLPPSLPKQLQPLIQACTEKDRARRPDSARAVERELLACLTAPARSCAARPQQYDLALAARRKKRLRVLRRVCAPILLLLASICIAVIATPYYYAQKFFLTMEHEYGTRLFRPLQKVLDLENPTLNADSSMRLLITHSRLLGKARVLLRARVETGEDLTVIDELGRRPLHTAVLNVADYAVALFLRHGADPNASDFYGRSPLHLLASNDETVYWNWMKPIADALFAYGADCSLKDHDGRTPLLLAIDAGNSRFADYLSEQGTCRSAAPDTASHPSGMPEEVLP